MRRSTICVGALLVGSVGLNAILVLREARRMDRVDRMRSVPFSRVEPAGEANLQLQVRRLEDELADLRAKATPSSSHSTTRHDLATPLSGLDDAAIAAKVRGKAAFLKLKRDVYDYQQLRSEVTPEPVFVNDLLRMAGEFLGLTPDRLPALTSAIDQLAEALHRAWEDYQVEVAPLKAMPDSEAKKIAEEEARNRYWKRHEQALTILDGAIGEGVRAMAFRKWAPTLAEILRCKREGDRTGQYVYFGEIVVDEEEEVWP